MTVFAWRCTPFKLEKRVLCVRLHSVDCLPQGWLKLVCEFVCGFFLSPVPVYYAEMQVSYP